MIHANPLLNQWYIIYTRSRFEKKLYQALLKSGFQTFLPLIKEKRIWSDRLKTVIVPLLPSYVFVKINRTEFRDIYHYPGFVRFISNEGQPSTIREEEISLLDNIVKNGFKAQQVTPCRVGDKVRVIKGPLKDWEGCVERKAGQSRITFQFDGFQQAICVEVSARDVERIK